MRRCGLGAGAGASASAGLDVGASADKRIRNVGRSGSGLIARPVAMPASIPLSITAIIAGRPSSPNWPFACAAASKAAVVSDAVSAPAATSCPKLNAPVFSAALRRPSPAPATIAYSPSSAARP